MLVGVKYMKLKLNNGCNYIYTSRLTVVIPCWGWSQCEIAVFWVGMECVWWNAL